MPTIQTITDAMLIDSIRHAKNRVVLIAPGVWPPLAEAIAEAWSQLGPEQVTVILDVDPEICRIGYGSLEGLQILQAAAKAAREALGEEPGVRICVIIVDDQTFVFSPTPRQLEAPPDDSPVAGTPQPKANGIVLSKPPAGLETELGSGPEGIAGRTLGMETLKEEKLEKVKKDLAVNPPKSFDLSRAVNVYNAKIQFVELKVSGYRVSQQKVTLPKHLVSVAKKNKELARKIDSAVKLLDSEDPLVGGDVFGAPHPFGPRNVSQIAVEEVRAKIEEEFLRPVKGIGKIILRNQIPEFQAEVKRLEMTLAAFSIVLSAALSELFQNTANQIADAILDEVLNQLPERWLKQLGPNPNPDRVRYRIVDDLMASFGEPEKRAQTLKATVVFKDVSYDMLTDPEFNASMAEYFADSPLMEEFKAAKERPVSTQDNQIDIFP
jgi:hypothetical protein